MLNTLRSRGYPSNWWQRATVGHGAIQVTRANSALFWGGGGGGGGGLRVKTVFFSISLSVHKVVHRFSKCVDFFLSFWTTGNNREETTSTWRPREELQVQRRKEAHTLARTEIEVQTDTETHAWDELRTEEDNRRRLSFTCRSVSVHFSATCHGLRASIEVVTAIATGLRGVMGIGDVATGVNMGTNGVDDNTICMGALGAFSFGLVLRRLSEKMASGIPLQTPQTQQSSNIIKNQAHQGQPPPSVEVAVAQVVVCVAVVVAAFSISAMANLPMAV